MQEDQELGKICRKCGAEFRGKDIPQGDKCPKCGGWLVYANLAKR